MCFEWKISIHYLLPKYHFLLLFKTAASYGGSKNILLLSVISSHQQSQSAYPAAPNNYIRNLPSAADTWRYW